MRSAGWIAWCALAICQIVRPASADDRSPLVEAARQQDRAAVLALLEKHADARQTETDGTTALHWAAHWGDLPMAEALLAAGADAKAANRYGVQPISVAAEAAQAEIVARLLAAGADPNTANAESETLLMLAARSGSAAAIQTLVKHGAKVNTSENWRGQTALMWAAIEGHTAAAQALIDSGAMIDARSKKGFSALHFAARAGHVEMARLLLDAAANVNVRTSDGASPLLLATLNARWELGTLLLTRGAEPNADGQGWAALHQVALTRNPHHDNVNPQPIPSGNQDSLRFVEALLDHGADVNLRTRRTPVDGFRQWIRRDGATAFFLAAKAADLPLMKLLVEHGADPLLATTMRVTPLAAAAGIGYCQGESPGTDGEALDAVKYLLERGGDVNSIDADGFTPMHGAAARGSNTLVQFLYDHGAKLDVPSKDQGWTPWAMANGVLLADTFKRQLHTADYLQQLLNAEAARATDER